MSLHFHSIAGDRFISNGSDAGTPEYDDESNDVDDPLLLGTVRSSNINRNEGSDDEYEDGRVRPNEVTRHPAHHHIAGRDSWPFGTYRFHEVPPNFKEPYIFTGYRSPTCSVTECLKYCFIPNNEMMNVWTHLIPFVVTTYYIFELWLVREYDFVNDSYTWPLLTYLISCCVYPLVSAFAHCFDCCSAKARHVMFFMDYAAIAMYGLATCIAHYAYSFPKEFDGTSLKYLFVPVAFYNSCFMPVLSCESRFIEFSPYCKKLRILAFTIPAAWGSLPIIYRLFFGDPTLNNITEQDVRYHKMQFLTGAFSTILYGFRFPESFFPGKFDVFFHSHQIFHVFCTIGTVYQMWGIMGDYHYFKGQRLHDPSIFTFKWSLGLWLLGILWCVVIIRCCQKRVYVFQEEDLRKMLLHVPRVTCTKRNDSDQYQPETHSSDSASSSSSSSDDSSIEQNYCESEANRDNRCRSIETARPGPSTISLDENDATESHYGPQTHPANRETEGNAMRRRSVGDNPKPSHES